MQGLVWQKKVWFGYQGLVWQIRAFGPYARFGLAKKKKKWGPSAPIQGLVWLIIKGLHPFI
jgi:hypothetical protein